MSDKSRLIKKLHVYKKNKNKYRDINCIISDLYENALDNINSFTEEQINAKLFGKLFAVKDNINIKGSQTSCASKILKNHISLYSSTAINRLETAGGVCVAKTNLDEFAMGSSNEHSVYGLCKNPKNTEYVPGGSSGGSAAIVAAGLVDIALGSDTGGSVRQPASFCGVYGFKPTYGRISRFGLTSFASSFDQIGVIASNISDIVNTYEVIAGFDKYDNTSAKHKIDKYIYSNKVAENLTVGIPKEYFDIGMDDSVKSVMDNVIKFLHKRKFNVKEISLPLTDKCISTYYILTTAEAASNLSRYDGIKYGIRKKSDNIIDMYKQTRSIGFGDEVKRRIIVGTFVLSSGYYDAYYSRALKVRRLIKQDFDKAFNKVDVILTPTSPFPPFKVGEKFNDPVKMYLSDVFTVPMSLAGLPCISVPCGKNKNDMPIGMQLVANQFHENSIFQMSSYIEKNYKNINL